MNSKSKDLSQTPFHQCTLFASLRSPYARRVRVAFLEYNLAYHEVMEDVFQPSTTLLAHNPLGRVPAVSLKNGIRLCESQVILSAFESTLPESQTPRPSLEERAISGLMLGLCDKIVERLLETLRPKEAQDPEIFADFERLLPATLSSVESWAQTAGPTGALQENPLPQAAIDLGVTLAYLNLRVGDSWQGVFPHCKNFLEQIQRRASFLATMPPPPT